MEQDLTTHVKCEALTNEILSRIRTFSLGPFRSTVNVESLSLDSIRAQKATKASESTVEFFVEFTVL